MCLQAGELSADCTTARGKEQRGQGMPCHVFQSISRLQYMYSTRVPHTAEGRQRRGKVGGIPPSQKVHALQSGQHPSLDRSGDLTSDVKAAFSSLLLPFFWPFFCCGLLLLRPSFAAAFSCSAFSCSGLLLLRPSLAPAFSRSGLLLLRPSFAPVLSFPGRLQGFQVAGSGSSSASAAVLPHLPPRHHSTVLTPDGRRHVEESSRGRSTTGAERRMGKTRGESRKQRREMDWLYTVLD